MTKNPYLNAAAGFGYIVVVASVLFFGSSHVPNHSFLGPIAFLSLFTLSASVMGYVLLYQPLQLYFDNKKKSAVKLFFQTLLAFGVMTVVLLVILFSGIIK